MLRSNHAGQSHLYFKNRFSSAGSLLLTLLLFLNTFIDLLIIFLFDCLLYSQGAVPHPRWICFLFSFIFAVTETIGDICILCLHPGTEDRRLSYECNSKPVCPAKCRCEANVVDCSNLRLTKFPEHLPPSTEELWDTLVCKNTQILCSVTVTFRFNLHTERGSIMEMSLFAHFCTSVWVTAQLIFGNKNLKLWKHVR